MPPPPAKTGQQQAPKTVVCPKCHHVNDASARFCEECGAVLRTGGCPRCGAEVKPGQKFCSQCGYDLRQILVPAPGGQPAQPPGVPAAPATPSQGTGQGEVGSTPVQPEQSYPTLKIGGFHNVDYISNPHNTTHGFDLGQFVLHTNSLLSPNTQFFSEISFTPNSGVGMGTPPAGGYNVDVERAILRYDVSDQVRLSAGRYHTPINWWNTAYHHGLWLQTTVDRPEMVEFGGQFIPVHFVGLLEEGSTPAGGLGLNYKAGIGNGRGSDVARAGDFGDKNAALAWLADIYVRPERLYGWQLGGSVYRDKISLTNQTQYNEWITSAHLVLETETPEFITEYAHVSHQQLGTGRTWDSDAFYTQVAYRLPWFDRRFKPYVRYERMWIPGGEPVFTNVSTLDGVLGGIRWDFSDFAAFKLEYRDFRRSTLPYTTGLISQLSYTF